MACEAGKKALLELRVHTELLLSDAQHLKQLVEMLTNMWLSNSLNREHMKQAEVYLEHIEKSVKALRKALEDMVTAIERSSA